MKKQRLSFGKKTALAAAAALLLAACAQTAPASQPPAQSEAPRSKPDSLEAAQAALEEAQDAYEKAVDELIRAMEDYEAMKAEEAPGTAPEEDITPETVFGEATQALTDYLNENVVPPTGEKAP